MTMTNAEWMINNGYKFSDLYVCKEPLIYKKPLKDGAWNYHIHLLKADIDEISSEHTILDALTAWLDAEHVEPILDDAERQYLSAVVKPFRCKIKGIEKQRNWSNSSERIYFHVKKGDMFYLLDFKLGTMYKGMKLNRKYTLEELGL